jgi:PAS domain S-box-containing protein
MDTAPAPLRTLYVGTEEDAELRLLLALPAGRLLLLGVVTPATLAATVEAARVDLVVSAAGLDARTVLALEPHAAVLDLAGGAATRGTVSLPRQALTSPTLELAIALAVERHASRRAKTTFFEDAPVGLALVSGEDRILDVNPALTSLMRTPREKLVGQPGTRLAGSPRQSTVRLLARGGAPSVIRERQLTRDSGSTLEAQVGTAPLASGTAERSYLRSVVDVTPLHEARAKLASDLTSSRELETEARDGLALLEAVVEELPQGVLLADARTGEGILVNRRWRDLLGDGGPLETDARERLLSLALTLGDGSPCSAADVPLHRTLDDGAEHSSSDLWVQVEGRPRKALAMRSARVALEGREVAVAIVEDLTALRSEERHRLEAEERCVALFRQATDAIFVAREEGFTVLDANPAALRLLGLDLQHLAGRSFDEAVPEQDPAVPATHLAEHLGIARRDGAARFARRFARTPGDDPVELEVLLQPLQLETPVVLIHARDVTRQRHAENELVTVQKLEALETLAGGVAHDFNNLLAAVVGFVELVLEDLPPGGAAVTHRKFLNEARRAASRGVQLTRQLLSFSRRSSSKLSRIDLNASVERTGAVLGRLLGQTVRVAVDLSPVPLPIEGDAAELEQALTNLATNARDAMPHGGTLRIETRLYEPSAVEAEPLGLPAGRYALLVVSDDGAGMSDSVRSRIFQPFFTTKERGRGTGLGLALVHGVVQRHRGRIFVDSAIGAGTTFRVLLPLAEEAAEAPGGTPRALPHGTESLLVVDDDPMVLEVTATMLESLGYRVVRASSAAQALEAIGRVSFDLAITDVVMPDVDGLELERRLNLEHPGLRVLLVSGYAREAFAAKGVDERSAKALLAKPLTLEVLARTVRRLLDEKRG